VVIARAAHLGVGAISWWWFAAISAGAFVLVLFTIVWVVRLLVVVGSANSRANSDVTRTHLWRTHVIDAAVQPSRIGILSFITTGYEPNKFSKQSKKQLIFKNGTIKA
jgi:hypothetical protein